jgi:hypothetical protein
MEGLTLYDIMWLYSGLVALPATIPLTLGMFIKHTPAWSAWSTVLVGFCYSLYMFFGLDPANIAWISDHALSAREIVEFRFFAGTVGNIFFCTAWFLFTKIFYHRSPQAYRDNIDGFFNRMATPIDFLKEHGKGTGREQGIILGTICIIYAGFLTLVALFVPHERTGSIVTYAGVIGLMALIGAALWLSSKRATSEQ